MTADFVSRLTLPFHEADVSGIYAIRNTINGRVYVGSSVNIRKRWQQHRKLLDNRRHHCPPLQQSWNKYGIKGFAFEVLEIVLDVGHLIRREQFWIDKLNAVSRKTGFNVLPNAGGQRGYKWSDEQRAKIAGRGKGIKRPWVSLAFKGRKAPWVTAALKGKKRPQHSAALKGRKNPKISIALKGRKAPWIVTALKGRPKSPEHAAKIRALLVARNKSWSSRIIDPQQMELGL